MFPELIPKTNPGRLRRPEEQKQVTDHKKTTSLTEKMDKKIKESIDRAFWQDEALRVFNSYEAGINAIGIRVENRVVYLNGHILNAVGKKRIENVIRDIPDILRFKNDLVLDNALALEVAASLANLERTYACKFFIGVSYGVVSLNGIVSNESVKSLAEKCASDNPNVRGVANHVRVSGSPAEVTDQPFMQPAIGEAIYFLDGISGIVKQVIINPNNRRVIAMTLQGRFTDQIQDLKALNSSKTQPRERVIILRMSMVRYLTKVSGFLDISSHEKDRYLDFDPGYFTGPDKNWTPPYPYCLADVLFPVEYQHMEKSISTPQ